jgi:hypothetical protein
MRILIGSLLVTAALGIHAANAGSTVPDYQLRSNKPAFSTATTPRDANAAMPSAVKNDMPTRFYEIPSRR